MTMLRLIDTCDDLFQTGLTMHHFTQKSFRVTVWEQQMTSADDGFLCEFAL